MFSLSITTIFFFFFKSKPNVVYRSKNDNLIRDFSNYFFSRKLVLGFWEEITWKIQIDEGHKLIETPLNT